ncbi:MAG: radical SAM family heme chaperone HemW [Dehalococcoidia bacterium]
MNDAVGPAPVSLYLHIPFCDHKCSYCDFNSYAGLERMIPAFTDALLHELRAWAPEVRGKSVPTVFFGGGTPSLMPLGQMSRVLDAVRAEYELLPDAEISLEANPGTVDEAYLAGLRDLGVNRLSIGVQSLDDSELRALDRIHDARAAVAAHEAARAAGFDNINLDLIFGLAGQTLPSWETTLRRAIELGPEHLSLYALTIEEGTPLAAQIARGIAPEPDADLQAAMYERTQDLMAAAGYEHYEISNWCRPGYACRHNLVYWRDGDWLGLGPGAHSHLDGRRFAVIRSPSGYIDRAMAAPRLGETVTERMPQVVSEETPDERTARADAAMLALRLVAGLDEQRFARRFGLTPDEAFGEALAESAGLGLVERENGVIRLTRRGRLFSNEVFVRLLT